MVRLLYISHPSVYHFSPCDMKTPGLIACFRPFHKTPSEPTVEPTLASCNNNPGLYAKKMERHCDGDMAKLYAHHVAQQPADQQRAIINGSEALRDFLGIRNPNGLRKRLLSSGSSSSRIPDADALTALATAATRLNTNTRAMRALVRLDEVLEKSPPSSHTSNEYHLRVEKAFSNLLEEFHELRTEAAQQKALEIIERHLPSLNVWAKADIVYLARNTMESMEKQGISNELKTRFDRLIASGRNARPERSSQTARANDAERARFENILRNSARVHPQSPSIIQNNPVPDISVQQPLNDISEPAESYAPEVGNAIHADNEAMPPSEEAAVDQVTPNVSADLNVTVTPSLNSKNDLRLGDILLYQDKEERLIRFGQAIPKLKNRKLDDKIIHAKMWVKSPDNQDTDDGSGSTKEKEVADVKPLEGVHRSHITKGKYKVFRPVDENLGEWAAQAALRWSSNKPGVIHYNSVDAVLSIVRKSSYGTKAKKELAGYDAGAFSELPVWAKKGAFCSQFVIAAYQGAFQRISKAQAAEDGIKPQNMPSPQGMLASRARTTSPAKLEYVLKKDQNFKFLGELEVK